MGRLTSYGPQAGLAGLALLSLVMMVRLVRKSARVVDGLPLKVTADVEPEEPRPLDSAEATEGYLVGQEVDEDTVRYQNLSQQVSKMVEEDPQGAAELIRQWMSEG